MSKREDLIKATKTLLWEKGYEATSPRDIQARSNAGQGSFYHHFPSKQELARVAIEEIVDQRIHEFEQTMALNKRFRERLSIYLAQNGQPLLGCRVGRLVWDAAIDEDALRQPMARYFEHLESRLTEILNNERAAGTTQLAMPAARIALIIVTCVQGGFTLNRVAHDDRTNETRAALMAFLNLAIT